MNNPVQKIGIPNKRYPVGTGWVIIPAGIERDIYVKNCYRTGTVAMLFEDGSYMPRVPIGMSILKEIDFPDEIKQLGSQLVCVTLPLHNQPIVIDRILKDDESTSLNENEFRLEKYTEAGVVSISGRADKGNLFINVDGKTKKGGKVYIDVGNTSETGEVILNIKGDLKTEIKNVLHNVLETYNVKAKKDVNVDSEEKINLGTGDEPLLLGNTTQEQLNALQTKVDLIISAIENGVPGSSDGGLAYQTSMKSILSAKQDADFSNIKSEKSFTE